MAFSSVGFVGSIARRRELCFALFQFCNVRIYGNNTPISGSSFIDPDPAAVAAMLDVRFARGMVARYSFRNPGITSSLGILDLAAFDGCAQNSFEARAGH
jgi:hypothetical protein